MKLILILLVVIFSSLPANAQLLKKIKKGTEKAVENVIVKKSEEKAASETGKIMDTILNPKFGTKDPKPAESDINSDTTNQKAGVSSPEIWTAYDFVGGSEVIFTDDLESEQVGEFPSRWDLIRGNAENVTINGIHAIKIDHKGIITPLVNSNDYLSESFTVEFDAFFNDVPASWQKYLIRFYNGAEPNKKFDNGDILSPLLIQSNGARITSKVKGSDLKFEKFGSFGAPGISGWKHIAISFNERALKVFIDKERILNIPNISLKPSVFSIEAQTHKEDLKAVKNIRIAKGGTKLYSRLIEEGKFITSSILFDVNKSTIKPESGGLLSEIAQMMKEHPETKFSIEGHTDSDGEAVYNLELSKSRAEAVKNTLIQLGISEARLETKGFGEEKPISENNTPEGKANNRRVEFIKISTN